MGWVQKKSILHFYKYKLPVSHVYFGPHSYWTDNLTYDLQKNTISTKYTYLLMTIDSIQCI